MIPILRRHAAALLACLAVSLPAAATTYSTDYTDLWYNPNESGWGVNLIQQNETIFATLFVYGADTAPNWFVASNVAPVSTGNQTTFTGTLYKTTGPFFGATQFDPDSVRVTVVGTITFTFTSATTATMQYVVNGTLITKSVVRQTWRMNQLGGNYLGGLTAVGTNCGGGVSNGNVLIFGTVVVQDMGGQAANKQVSMNVQFTSAGNQSSQCTFAGPYSQAGKLGTITGSWNCTTSNAGNFTLSSIEANVNGFTGHFHGTDQFCTYDGQFGGVRDVL
jgi:hypothetical protein